MKKLVIIIIGLILVGIAVFLFYYYFSKTKFTQSTSGNNLTPVVKNKYDALPLSIAHQRTQRYQGSNFQIEQTLPNGTNYKQYIASYKSDGLTIYGLLSIPMTPQPPDGYPAIIFNHGYIPPEEYRTTERYVAYFDSFAKNGYIVFKPDYRGNGNSEGKPEGAYFSPGYTVDVLNAVSSIKKMKEINVNKIGMWGHSMGGFLTLRALVISKDIKAAVIWGGVVGSYKDMSDEWWSKRQVPSFSPSARELQSNRPTRQSFIKKYGVPSDNEFWSAISATTYLKDITAPIQLDHGSADETVPPILSQLLYDKLKGMGKTVELYMYPGSDHNISQGFGLAMSRSVDFFNKYLK